MSINNKLIPVPFAVNAGDTYKYSIPQTNTTTYPNKATYETGFPAVTMADIAAGGVPPFGQDFNGVLNDITTAIRYIQSGNYQTYDSAFAESIGGYDKGSVILGSDGKLYQSTADSNKANPVGGSGWVGFIDGKYLPLTGGTLTGTLTGTDITAKTSLTVGSAKATYSAAGLNFDKPMTINSTPVLKQGDYGVGGYATQPQPFDLNNAAVNKNTGFYQIKTECTNQPYSGAIGINQKMVSYDGQFFCNLFFDYTNFGSIYYNSNRSGKISWVKLITTENIGDYQSGLGFNQTWQNVTASRAANVEYTNTGSKPITIIIGCNGRTQDNRFWVSGVIVSSGSYEQSSLTVIVPPGGTYRTNIGFNLWVELK